MNISSETVQLSVAMCTYNGALHLDEQLNSIIQQTLLPDELVVCDDQSEDETVGMLRRFTERAPFPVRIYINSKRLGPKKNFEQAIRNCRGKYIALSDQDDVWLPHKLKHTLSVLKMGENRYGVDVPLLVHTDLYVVDKYGMLLNSSFMQLQHIRHVDQNPLRTLLVQNFVTGCTTVMNRVLVEKSQPFPDVILMHDWWVALIAASIGKILFIPTPTISYRQHAANVVGAKGLISLKNLYRFFDKKKLNQELVACFEQGIVLEQHLINIYGSSRSYENRTGDLLKIFEAISNKGGFSALRKALSIKICKQGLMRNLAFYWILLRGKYGHKQ